MKSQFQSTFPQGERHSFRERTALPVPVSIHVPARGTTEDTGSLHCYAGVSIHVPARGTTIIRSEGRIYRLLFQSTFPQGERLDYNTVLRRVVKVSIHVPARGTTLPFLPVSSADIVSIHVPARGTTQVLRSEDFFEGFQSTFPQGERHLSGLFNPADNISFNPRSRKGNDRR